MNLILQVLTGSRYGQRIVIGPGEIRTVGRSAAAQHSFDDDDHMSSIHFEVENFGEYAEVRDRRSTNRTWLNSGHISQAKLSHGDRIRAGKTVLGVELEHASMGSSIQHSVSQSGSLVTGGAQSRGAEAAPVSASPGVKPIVPPPVAAPPVVASPVIAPAVAASAVAAPVIAQPPPAAAAPTPVSVTPVTPSEAHAAARPAMQPESPYIKSPYPAANYPAANYPAANYPAAPYAQVPYIQRASAAPPQVAQHNATPVHIAQPQIAQAVKHAVSSPIESVDLSEFVKHASDNPQVPDGPANANNPISDSSLWLTAAPSGSGALNQRRFRIYERSGDFQTMSHLRGVINTLRMKKTVRIVAHFAKIRMETPTNLTQALPVYPNLPAAESHWPVALTYQDWESETVQSVALRLCNNDALMVLVSEFNTDLDAQIHRIGREGVPGLCEPEGFLGWCWPSAFYGMLMILGSQRWSDVLGPGIEGAIMISPTHSHKLLAFSADSLAADLEPLGFSSEL